MRAGGQVATVVVCGLVFVGLGLMGLSGPVIAQLFNALPLAIGSWFVVAGLRMGAHRKGSSVVYRGVGTRHQVLAPGGVVELRTSMYLPFVYLHELVVGYPDGTEVSLPGASASSFHQRPRGKALRRQATLQRWLDEIPVEADGAA